MTRTSREVVTIFCCCVDLLPNSPLLSLGEGEMQLCACAFLHLGRSPLHGGAYCCRWWGLFFGGELCWRGRGKGWVLVDIGYLCLCLCFLFKWMLGALFFCWGGILLEGKGEGVGACRQWMCCAFFCVFCLSAWWGLFLSGERRGRRGGGLDK